LSLPIGGILFGIAFITMAKTIGKDNPKVQYYLKFGAYGVILVFVAMQTTITRLNYPPFGILSISIVGLASYVMFIGLYSSAISTSIDKKLMQTIRETISNAKFLHTLAEAEAISQIMNLATKEEEKFKKETGIESSLTVEETTNYLQMVMQEISESKKE